MCGFVHLHTHPTRSLLIDQSDLIHPPPPLLYVQVTGQPSVLYYAATLFDDVGMSSLASVLTGAFKLAATLLAVWGVDKHGRRSLLLIGCALMLVALLTLGVAFAFPYVSVSECNGYTTSSTCGAVSQCAWSDACVCDGVDDCTCCGSGGFDAQKVTILTALFVYIGGYQVGFGPVVWLLIAELFPLELRGKAISMAVVRATQILFVKVSHAVCHHPVFAPLSTASSHSFDVTIVVVPHR